MTNEIIDVLIKLAPLIHLLAELEPVNAIDLPKEYANDLKQLENLGLVYRRNSRSCALQRQRLIRIIERESKYVSASKQEKCFCTFGAFLPPRVAEPPSVPLVAEAAGANAVCV